MPGRNSWSWVSLLGALSSRNDEPDRACRPFDRTRDGFVLGEGAGVLVLESETREARGAKILGYLDGFGTSANAWRITDSPPDGRGASANDRSLLDAGLSRIRLIISMLTERHSAE